MKRLDRIKLDFTRNRALPGKQCPPKLLRPFAGFKQKIRNLIVCLTNEMGIFTGADNYIEYTLLSTGTYEDELNKQRRISFKVGSNTLDKGGNIGLQSIPMPQYAGRTGKVFAFESLIYLQRKFSCNMPLNKADNISRLPSIITYTVYQVISVGCEVSGSATHIEGRNLFRIPA